MILLGNIIYEIIKETAPRKFFLAHIYIDFHDIMPKHSWEILIERCIEVIEYIELLSELITDFSSL